MPFENVKIIDPYVESGRLKAVKLITATIKDVEDVEAKLNVSFPQGYKEYVTHFGLGQYCNYITVEMPNEILSGYKEYQNLLEEHYSWEIGTKIITKERVFESIKIAYTEDNDVIIFHPSNPRELIVLPNIDDMLYICGTNLYEAIDWLCVSRQSDTGSVGETHEQRYFVPWNPLVVKEGWLVPKNI